MILPLLIFTLFPYTTLFRSWWNKTSIYGCLMLVAWLLQGCATVSQQHVQEAADSQLTVPVIKLKAKKALDAGQLDRKSTRLNSSHTVISYAVFCLKKNNKEQQCQSRSAESPRADAPESIRVLRPANREVGRSSPAPSQLCSITDRRSASPC